MLDLDRSVSSTTVGRPPPRSRFARIDNRSSGLHRFGCVLAITSSVMASMILPACHHPDRESRTTVAESTSVESSAEPTSGADDDYAMTETRNQDSHALLTRNVHVETVAPNRSDPVTAAIAVAPDLIAPGGSGVVVLRIATAPMWHVYPPRSDLPPMYAPLSPTLTLPSGISLEGNWHWPQSHVDPTTHVHVLKGEFELRRLVHVEEDIQPGTFEIICDLGYQACDPTMCLPPTSRKLIALIEIVGEED